MSTSIRRCFFILMLCIGLVSLPSRAQISNVVEVEQSLVGKDYALKSEAIVWLAQSGDDNARFVFEKLMQGNVYFHKKTKQIVYASKVEKGASLPFLFSDETIVVNKKRDFKKVGVNNQLRSELRTQLASLDLYSDDASTRFDAAKNLLSNASLEHQALIQDVIKQESDAKVRDVLALALAIIDLRGSDEGAQRAAIERISDSKRPEALQALNLAKQELSDPELLILIDKSIADYQASQKRYAMVETLYFGLSLGSVLVLAGIGLAITFGVMGVINMAHGELIMLGAYTTYVLQQLMPNNLGASLLISIPIAFMVSAIVGIIIERLVIRHLYNRPLETLLATFGISLILQQAVRSVFSPLNRSVATPEFMSGMFEVNPMLSLTNSRLYILLFCMIVFVLLVLILKKTALGLQVRAVSQNREMAKAMGVRSERVDAMTFGLGSGIAGVAGVALSQLTNVGPNMGQAYIIDSFMVVVFGGVGNLWGTLVAGLSLGIFNKMLEPWVGAVLSKILVLVFIILFIQKRPRGLFPQKGRAVES
ncbi:urea ABC transporter permease subunit UrtB [Alginatibacterium sediminis]|uniref:urea ABC transporter permease subunit UrtB n=1 Tax=Alginatibacterium sediminis TaxID=2164068 RepID=UPI0018F4F31E|nr:urea ABC transporter permease subunit UrtB [Alginatibacterium sediminis]